LINIKYIVNLELLNRYFFDIISSYLAFLLETPNNNKEIYYGFLLMLKNHLVRL